MHSSTTIAVNFWFRQPVCPPHMETYYLRQLFRILFRTLNHQYDYTFDWTMLKQKAAASVPGSSNLPPNMPPPPQ